jgi:GTPase Era involved in 16S rRNA processing
MYIEIAKSMYDDIDTIVFMVSLTSYLHNSHDGNNLYKSLKLFQEFCENPKYVHCKFILLFNKTSALKYAMRTMRLQNERSVNNKNTSIKNLQRNDIEMLKRLMPNEVRNIWDNDDIWDWKEFIHSLFRLQHLNRTAFSIVMYIIYSCVCV